MDDETQNWREQAQHWHEECVRLRKELEVKQQVTVAADPSTSLIDNVALVEDLARYSEGGLTRDQVKRRWKNFITEEMWKTLGDDNELVDAIEARKSQRIRDGSLKRERAQTHIVRGPDALASIMDNPESNARHKVDAIKTLDALAGGNSPEAKQQDRIVIKIDLGADIRAAGGTPDPKDVLVIETSPSPLLTDGNDDGPI
jgi:hypothetical protein